MYISKEIKPASLPSFLAPVSPDTLPLDTPVFVAPDHIYLQPHTNNLFVDGCEPLVDKLAENDELSRPYLGRVGLMKVTLHDGEALNTGYVIDIRLADVGDFAGAPPEEPTGIEQVDAAFDMAREHMSPVAAFAYVDKIIEGEDHAIARNTPRTIKEVRAKEDPSAHEQTSNMQKPHLLDILGGVVDVVKENAAQRMVVRKLTKGLKQQVRSQVAEQLRINN